VTGRNGMVLGYVSVYPSGGVSQPGTPDARLVGIDGGTIGWVRWDEAAFQWDITDAYRVVHGTVSAKWCGNRFEAGAAGLALLSGFSPEAHPHYSA
jgi:hypothetical protein